MSSCRYNTDRGAKSMVGTLTRRNFLKYTAWIAADIALTAGVRGGTKVGELIVVR